MVGEETETTQKRHHICPRALRDVDGGDPTSSGDAQIPGGYPDDCGWYGVGIGWVVDEYNHDGDLSTVKGKKIKRSILSLV